MSDQKIEVKVKHYSEKDKKTILNHFNVLFDVTQTLYTNGTLKINIEQGSFLYILRTVIFPKKLEDPINNTKSTNIGALQPDKYNLVDIYTVLHNWIIETHTKHGGIDPKTSYIIHVTCKYLTELFVQKQK